MLHHMNIDIETYSSIPIADCGLYKYAQSWDFEILLFGYSIDGSPPVVIDLAAGEEISPNIRSLLFDECTVKHAYNAAFEWYCLSRYCRLQNPEAWLPQWRDTMLHGLYCGYPAGLGAIGYALGLPEDKRKLSAGKALIKTFCVPRVPTAKDTRTRVLPKHEPEKWNLFKGYNAQDVTAEMEIERRLSHFPVPEEIQKQWEQDQVINLRGVALDLDLVNGAVACNSTVTGKLTEEAERLTGLQNPNSVPQLSNWLRECGIGVESLTKTDVADLLKGKVGGEARRALEIRQELSKTSVKKYTAMEKAVCTDGRARGLLQFYGANRTGRWAGRLIQVQNLPRTNIHGTELEIARNFVKGRETAGLEMLFGSVPDVLSQLIRTAFVPKEGRLFLDADFSAIEARIVAWLAEENWVLEVFRTHGKIYEAQASQMFGVPLERIQKGNPEYELRQKGKVATLALGYQGGTGALINMGALRMGIREEELPEIIQRWRSSNPRIVDFWYKVENAALTTIGTGRQSSVHGLIFTLESDQYNTFLTIRLPSGRKLYYVRPYLGKDDYGRKKIYYRGVNQTTRKWEEIGTFGGKLTENIVQAVARDCLAEGIRRLEAAGYPVVFHVHDEVVLEVTEGQADLNQVCRLMGVPVPWAPGLPLAADGWIGTYYTKE